MLIKTYKKRIFISIAGILLVILSMVCLTSFYVSRSIMKTGYTDTKIQQLHVINQQINYSCEQANDVLNLMAHDADIANAVKEIDRGTMSSVFVQAAKKLQNLIISRKTAYLYFKKVYIVSSKFILSENGIEANLTTEAETVTKNPYMSKLLTDEQFRQYIISNDSDVFDENILITHINETSFIVGILDFKRLLGEKQERMLYVFDSSNDLIFKDNESAERMEYVKENLEFFWRTTAEKTNAAAHIRCDIIIYGIIFSFSQTNNFKTHGSGKIIQHLANGRFVAGRYRIYRACLPGESFQQDAYGDICFHIEHDDIFPVGNSGPCYLCPDLGDSCSFNDRIQVFQLGQQQSILCNQVFSCLQHILCLRAAVYGTDHVVRNPQIF